MALKAQKASLESNAAFIAAFSYGIISVAITLVNKSVLSGYTFSSTMTLALLQGGVSLMCLEAMKARGYVDFPRFNRETARKTAPLGFCFMANVVFSLAALGRVNMPMFTALRRLTILFIIVEEYLLLGVVPSTRVLLTVLVMTLGAGIAVYKDFSFDLVSYGFVFATNLFTSLYTVFINKVKKDTGLSVHAILYFNNATMLPALFLLAWGTGDMQDAWKFKHYWSIPFQLQFQASVWLAFLLNLSTFYTTTLTSASAMTAVGQMKNFVVFLLGLVLFDDYKYEAWNFVGLLVGFIGSVAHTYITVAEKKAATAAAKTLDAKDNDSFGTSIVQRNERDRDSQVVQILDVEAGSEGGSTINVHANEVRGRTRSTLVRAPVY